jgi:hypothetical protein
VGQSKGEKILSLSMTMNEFIRAAAVERRQRRPAAAAGSGGAALIVKTTRSVRECHEHNANR